MKRLKWLLDTLLTVVVLVAAILVIWRQVMPAGRSGAPPRVEDASGTVPADVAATSRGSGRIVLVEVADFQCPFCGRHARDVAPSIRQTFVDTGLVREVFLNFPLRNHALARPASEAAICAGHQGRFWEMRDALFQNQAALTPADLTSRASRLDLDVSRFSDCVGNGSARSVLERDIEIARALGVRSTPTFFVGVLQSDGSVDLRKRVNGAVPLADFRSAINAVASPTLEARGEDAAHLGSLQRQRQP